MICKIQISILPVQASMSRFILIEINIHPNTTTDRGLFWGQAVYQMYISYVNDTLGYYI